MTVLSFEKAEKHQELMREEIQGLDFQTLTEWLNDYSWVEIQEMALAALRNGDGADFGMLMLKVIHYAAAQETEPDVERWAEDEERRAAGEFRANARISQADGVWVNPGIMGM